MVAETEKSPISMTVPQQAWSARTYCTILWGATFTVVALGIFREVFVESFGEGTPLKDLRHFSLDGELNIATWYSSALMLAAAALAAVTGRFDADTRQYPYWLAISVIMLLMSIDETASFHESFITLLDGWAPHSDYFHFAWVLLGIPFVILFALFSVPFLLRLNGRTAVLFVIAGALFVFGALVMEMIDGAVQVRLGAESLAYRLGAMSEDAFELAGMTLFVTALVTLLARLLERDERGVASR